MMEGDVSFLEKRLGMERELSDLVARREARDANRSKGKKLPPPISPTPGPLLLFYGDTTPTPPPYLISNVLPQTQIAFFPGQFGSGKTTVVVDVSLSVMTGEPFIGHSVERKGAVLWLAAEGANEIAIRIKAAALHRLGRDLERELPFAQQAFDVPLLTEDNAYQKLTELVSAMKEELASRFPDTPLCMIVIDTLGSAAGFLDENSASETQRVMNMLRRLSDASGALVLLIDHFGKSAETGIRGSSAKAAAADAILAVLADKDETTGSVGNRRLAITKLRSGPTGAIIPFTLKPVQVDEWGNTSCGVEWSTSGQPEIGKERKPAWSGNARVFKAAMVHAMIEQGERKRPFGFEAPEVKAVKLEAIRAEFYARYAAENPAAKQKAFKRMTAECVGRNLIASREIDGTDWLWFLDDAAAMEAQRPTTAA